MALNTWNRYSVDKWVEKWQFLMLDIFNIIFCTGYWIFFPHIIIIITTKERHAV